MSATTTSHPLDLGRSPFPPIADYGFLSDCETTALIAPGGAVEWLCLPRMDSPMRGDDKRRDRWARAAEEIRDDVLSNAVDGRGALCQHYGTDALDASLLLIPIVGFLPADDHRCRATVLAIADELTTDDLVLRYRVESTDDGLSGEEGTFTICSFALVSALATIGELDRARSLCEKLLSYASSLQLYAEEIDPHTGRHLGNFPQAFTHLGLIQAVMHIVRGEKKAQRRPS